MSLKDETDFITEDRADLLARLMAAQCFAKFFLFHALDAIGEHGIDFRKLPEWLDQTPLDRARKLKPHAAQSAIMEYFARLESGLEAAIQRKRMTIVR